MLDELDIDLVSNVSQNVKTEALILLALLMNSFLLPSYLSMVMMLATMVLVVNFVTNSQFLSFTSYYTKGMIALSLVSLVYIVVLLSRIPIDLKELTKDQIRFYEGAGISMT